MLCMFLFAGIASAQQWDKTFAKSDKVDHQKVAFYNRLRIQIVADLYVPKNLDTTKKAPAIIVGHPCRPQGFTPSQWRSGDL